MINDVYISLAEYLIERGFNAKFEQYPATHSWVDGAYWNTDGADGPNYFIRINCGAGHAELFLYVFGSRVVLSSYYCSNLAEFDMHNPEFFDKLIERLPYWGNLKIAEG